jgi:hypothetical protein
MREERCFPYPSFYILKFSCKWVLSQIGLHRIVVWYYKSSIHDSFNLLDKETKFYFKNSHPRYKSKRFTADVSARSKEDYTNQISAAEPGLRLKVVISLYNEILFQFHQKFNPDYMQLDILISPTIMYEWILSLSLIFNN